MADEQPMIASAVVVPEPEPEPAPRESPTTNLKRRQSSASEANNKRPRLESSYRDRTTESPVELRRNSIDNEQRAARRKSTQDEERKRGRRLFGSILGTLSQSSSTAQRRRADIEKKQQTKLKQQDAEQDQQKKERLEELRNARIQQQKKVDEESMHTRHANLLNQARFLRTKTEPALFYLPYKLTAEDEDRIEAQKDEVYAIMDKELEQFERRKDVEQRRKDSTSPADKAKSIPSTESPTVGREAPDDSEAAEPPTIAHQDTNKTQPDNDDSRDSTLPDADDHERKEVDEDHDRDDDHDEMVRGEEDTVLY